MPNRAFIGECVHPTKGYFAYECTYKFTALGIAYSARAGFGDGRMANLCQGMELWRLGALLPQRLLRRQIEDTFSIIDVEKLRANLDKDVPQS